VKRGKDVSKPRQPTQSDAKRLEEAAAWRVRLHAEQSVEADFQAFESWVADPVNRVAYDRVEMADAFIDTHAEVFVGALSPAKPGRYTRYAVTAGIVGFAASIFSQKALDVSLKFKVRLPVVLKINKT
jgi:ferric-dicitrate binding protein FerR (iron transport regulator)